MDFITQVLEPIIRHVKDHNGCKRELIGNSEIYRNLFATWFDKEERKLEDLPQEKKVKLWNQSQALCPDDRLKFCKAVEFWESF